MFFKRLSISLLGVLIVSGVALGANTASENNKPEKELTALAAPLSFNMTASPTNPTCNSDADGYITVTVLANDSLAFTYVIKNSSGTTIETGASTSTTFTTKKELAEGSYTITVTQTKYGYYKSQTLSLTDPDPISVTGSATSPSCAGGTGSITLSATGGSGSFTYYLDYGTSSETSNSTGSFSNVAEGSHSAVVKDSKGCFGSYDKDLKIEIPDAISISYTILSEITCADGYASVDIDGLPTDAFTISMKNASQPTKTYSYTSGYVYSTLDAGDYTVTVTRSSCSTDTDTKTFSIEAFNDVTISATPVTVNCANETATVPVTVTGGKTSSRVKVVLDNNNGDSSDDQTSEYFNYDLTNGASYTFTDVEIGSYILRWVDENNSSCTGYISYTVSGPSSPIEFLTAPTATAATCNGSSTGKITMSVTGGSSPYNYYIGGTAVSTSNTSSSYIATGIAARTYEVYVTDANGCETDKVNVTVEQPDPLTVVSISSLRKDNSCYGGSEGVIGIAIAGGNDGYVYSLKGPITRTNQSATDTTLIKGLTAGTYEISVSDANGCTALSTVTEEITESDSLQIETFDIDDLTCSSSETSLFVKAKGGPSVNYTYTLSGAVSSTQSGDNGVTFTQLIAGAYKLTIVGSEACGSIDTTFVIEDLTPMVISSYSSTINTTCSDSTGSLRLTVSGESPFTYSLDGGTAVAFTSSTTITGLTGKTAGLTHNITITDSNGCDSTITVSVVTPTILTYSGLISSEVSCKGESSGSIKFAMSGGTGGYTATTGSYTSSSSDTILFQNLAAGTYNITVKDDNGCPLTLDPVVVKEPTAEFKISTLTNGSIACNGETTTLTVDVSGGWSDSYSVSLVGAGVSLTDDGTHKFTLSGGDYIITTTQVNRGCKADTTYSISEPDALVVTVTDSVDVSCYGSNDAKISFYVTGGTSPYYYGLNGVSSATTSFTGDSLVLEGDIEKGTYQLAVRDKNSCTSNTVTINIDEPTQVEFEVTQVDSAECHGNEDGSFVAKASGGDGTYKYTLTYPSGKTKTQSNNGYFTSLGAGTYYLSVFDGSSCAAKQNNKEVVILEPDTFYVTNAYISDSVSCNGESDASITIEAFNDDVYDLQYGITNYAFQTSSVIENVAPGTYSVYVRDQRGKCTNTWSKQLTVYNPEKLTLLQPTIKQVSCYNANDGSITISASGGTGTYTYKLYDSGQNPLKPSQTSPAFTNLGTKTADPTQNSYTTYWYEVIDENGCSVMASFSIKNPSKVDASFVSKTNVTCNDLTNGTITLSVSGGTVASKYSIYDIDGNSYTATTASSTEYTISGLSGTKYYNLIISDDNSCTDTLSAVQIVNPPRLVIESVTAGEKLCYNSTNDSTIIKISETNCGTTGAYKYSINDGSTWTSATTELTYIFTNVRTSIIQPMVKDSNGCTATYEELEITWPDSFTVNVTKNEIKCWDRQYGSLTLEFDGGTGPYYYDINEQLFASATEVPVDTDSPTTTVTVGETDKVFLYNTIYDLYVKDANNCPALNYGLNTTADLVGTYVWSSVDTLSLNGVSPTSPKCNGSKGTVQYDVSGGTEPYYFWVEVDGELVASDDDDLVDVPTGVLLYCYVTDKNECDARVPDNLEFNYLTTYIDPINDTVKVEIDTLKQPYCPSTRDGLVGLEITGFLDGGVTFTVYKVDTVYDDEDEVYSEVITVDQATDSVKVTSGDTVSVSEWEYSIDDYEIDYKFSVGEYAISFVDNITECGVKYYFTLSPDTSECDDIFPNFFTPNGDGDNDYWVVSEYEKSNVDLKIFTAYGEIVYHFYGQVPEDGLQWQGEDSKGRPVPAGTYMYIYQPDLSDDKAGIITGAVTILRNN